MIEWLLGLFRQPEIIGKNEAVRRLLEKANNANRQQSR
jgi:hypothetical protein